MATASCDKWEGMFKPSRLMTEDELELLSPPCHDCSTDAAVVEAQMPLTEKEENQSLFDFAEYELRFFCANHSPIEVDSEQNDAADIAFYETASIWLLCPINGGRKGMCTCITWLPPCIDGCSLIRLRLGDLRPMHAHTSLTRGRRAYEKKYPGHFSPLHKATLGDYKHRGFRFSELPGLAIVPPYARDDEDGEP